MLRNYLRKTNPLIVGGTIAVLYIVIFSAVDLARGVPIDLFRRLITAAILGGLYFVFQEYINKKVDSLKHKPHE